MRWRLLNALLRIGSAVLALALSGLARGQATEPGVMFTAGGLAAAAVALVVSVLFPAEEESAG
jgi:hypothetical protein